MALLSVLATVGVTYVFGKKILAYPNIYFRIIVLMGLLYPLGKMLQLNLIGPGWIRWYLADVGFISCIALLLAFGRMIPPSNWILGRITSGIHVAFAVAVITELLQLSVRASQTVSGHAATARGDWVDLGIFITMYCVNLILIYRFRAQLVAYERSHGENLP
ncbi:MAG: hypothetical protein Q8O19_06050 [Rectinemataceae bacterium]|nr:hypothetical protein [Rectinemataceae bacterium]